MSNSMLNSPNLAHHLSYVHYMYNVQRICSKLELLRADLVDFDVLTSSEAWLNLVILTVDLCLESYNKPERKD